VFTDGSGALYIVDNGNNRVRKVTTASAPGENPAELSVPDTVYSYSQPASVPVRLASTPGAGIVAAEVWGAFDGDLLLPQSAPVTTTALTADWTLEYNLVQGVGSSMDTLKIAMATDNDTVKTAGDLLRFNFTMADRRSPASSPLALTHVLFNAGDPTATITNGSVALVGTDGTITACRSRPSRAGRSR